VIHFHCHLTKLPILYINSRSASVRLTRQFRVLIRRRNRPEQSDSENGIRPGQSDSENGIQKNGIPARTVGFGKRGSEKRDSEKREPARTVGRTDRQILYGRTGPDRRPLYNFDQRLLVSQSVSSQSVYDGGYQG
jgi:hypothetical protein